MYRICTWCPHMMSIVPCKRWLVGVAVIGIVATTISLTYVKQVHLREGTASLPSSSRLISNISDTLNAYQSSLSHSARESLSKKCMTSSNSANFTLDDLVCHVAKRIGFLSRGLSMDTIDAPQVIDNSNEDQASISKVPANARVIKKLPESVQATQTSYTPTTIPSVISEQAKWQQGERLNSVARECSGHNRTYVIANTVADHNMVSDAHRATFCLIPKAGCTNFEIMLVNANLSNPSKPNHLKFNVHNDKFMRKHGYQKLSKYSLYERIRRMNEYHRVIIVRHPLTRILSAYRNKFVERNPMYQKSVGARIINEFRENATEKAKKLGNDVTFLEFVKFLVMLGETGSKFDQHWSPFHRLCDPCNMQYTFVAKTETLNWDVSLLRTLVFKNNPAINMPPPYKSAAKDDEIRDYYAIIPPDLLERLIKVYEKDFDLFNYPKDLSHISR